MSAETDKGGGDTVMMHRARIVSIAGRAYVRCIETNATAGGKYVVEALSKLRQVCKCQHKKDYSAMEEEARHEATKFIKTHEDRTEATSARNARVSMPLRSNWSWR